MTRVTMKVMTTLIATVAPVDSGLTEGPVQGAVCYWRANNYLTFNHTHDCLGLSAPDSCISASDVVGSSQ